MADARPALYEGLARTGENMALKIAIVASGSGSNAQAMFDKIKKGLLDAEVTLVISNRPKAKVLERARNFGAPTLELDHKDYNDRESFDRVLVEALKKSGAELIVLAGYMRMLTPYFLEAFAGRVVNIHPALLPSFAGVHGARDARAWGVKISGCTVHLVDEIMDHGAVIAQAAVPVMPGESEADLQQRIHRMEHRIYPQVLQWFAEGRIDVRERDVHLLPGSKKPAALSPDLGPCLIWPPLEEGF